ncbi:hypothetical protein G6M78_20675 [Agrobacterium tumefaciens]|uniref:hypothetical protein n=1 Tax=Agrobacterium tumefaciens TaxID=358 RepID=UPI001571E605|nr:hypothetical protein [Agrobacterium tumefaciens]NTE57480.1 hypothetical protein [Agrobacterium tumefaciens]NTE69974.1 hypothetical protein [Agrobacterium tumefaciens]
MDIEHVEIGTVEGSGGFSGAWLGFVAKKADGGFNAKALVLSTTDKKQIVLSATFAQPILIPTAFITAGKLSIPTSEPLGDELLRRLSTQEIAWSGSASDRTFLKLPHGLGSADSEFRGDARLDLSGLSETPKRFSAEFSARGAVSVEFTVPRKTPISVTQTIAIVLVVEASGPPRLRFDFDDLNLSLPSFDFPNIDLPAFDLSKAVELTLGAGKGVSRLFNRVAQAIGDEVDVTVTPKGANPRLFVDFSAGRTIWRFDDDTGHATFDIVVKLKNASSVLLKVDAFSAWDDGSGAKVSGTIAAATSVDISPGRRVLGPLTVAWSKITVKPIASSDIVALDNVSLRASVQFERLMIYASDDPSAVIAFAGEAEVTPSGARMIELKIVEPYPFWLVQRAVGAAAELGRWAASVLELDFEIDTQAGDINGLKALLDVLGKIAAAIGQATAIAANAVKNVLLAVAEALGRLIQSLGDLVGQAGRNLAFEIRIATDPIELRQVLVTLKNKPSAPFSLSALGLKLDIHDGFEPGLLLDFVAAPGAYLIASPVANGGTAGKLATISTDLWLGAGDGSTRAIRDADGKDGERGTAKDSTSGNTVAKPLITLDLSARDQKELVVLIAGLSRGRGVFFQRITNVIRKPIGAFGSTKLVTADGPFATTQLDGSDFGLGFEFDKDRVLPLLGMGEPGKEKVDPQGSDTPGFLDKLKNSLSQTVWVKDWKTEAGFETAKADLTVGIKVAGLETEAVLALTLDMKTLEASINAKSGDVGLKSRRIEERALGLVWVVEQVNEDDRDADKDVEMFKLSFKDGETTFSLNEQVARMEIRFADLSSDGKGVALAVKQFGISRAGLDLLATASGASTTLNGINTPFKITTGAFEIRGGRLIQATIGGQGSLPRDLVGDVDCSLLLSFRQDTTTNEIVLQKGKVEFGKRGEPVMCHTTRFTLTINELDIAFVRDGGYHFYFLVTGAIEFTPRDGEFENGLLKYLKDVRIDLQQAPLTGDARVLAKHISFQKAFTPKKSFKLFELFEFELRGFGFHPSSPKFDGDPAMNISGQIKFAEIGDVMKPSIDFHGLWIAAPKGDNPLPRVRCDGLGVEIGLSGAARIRGTLIAVDPKSDWLEFGGLPPAGYDTYGFLGEGEVSIEGWGSMSASMGFLEVARKETPDERKKSFFLYLQANQLAIEIPVVVWSFWMREVGFGFGYRYTLQGIKAAANAKSTAALVKTLDDVSKRQGDLARFAAWSPDPEGDNVTLAMRALFQCYPAPDDWDEDYEKTAEEPFLFDIVAALRSDMTFLMSARGWVATNYHDFLSDTDGSKLRNNPGLRGYLYISAPRQELLLRAIGSSGGYVGDRLGDIQELKQALKSVDWSMTLFINPKLFHLELGWPNQLVARLKDEADLKVTVRGGLIFRVAEDGILWGFNIEADAFIAFKGGFDGGSIGVMVEASLTAKFVARLISFISWRVSGTLIYGLISLDANLEFRIRAWMEVDIGIDTITLRISFSRSVQFSAAVEMALSTQGVGARVQARITVSAFGCSLSVGLGFTIGGEKLEEARARVQRFMALGITNEVTPDPPNLLSAREGDTQVKREAERAGAIAAAPPRPLPASGPKPPIERAKFGRPIKPTDFWLVLRVGNGGRVYGLLVPRAPSRRRSDGEFAGGFYAPANGLQEKGVRLSSAAHRFKYAGSVKDVMRWYVDKNKFDAFDIKTDAVARWDGIIPAEGEQAAAFRLAHLFDECYLYDSSWTPGQDGTPAYRTTSRWAEPKAKRFRNPASAVERDEQERCRERDRLQRDRLVSVAEAPLDAACHDARSTVMASFIDQFLAFAAAGDRVGVGAGEAHVADLGLIFCGSAEALGALGSATDQNGRAADPLEVYKSLGLNGKGEPIFEAESGIVTVFNPRETWFEVTDPVFSKGKDPVVEAGGVKLDWRLQLFADQLRTHVDTDERGDPEQYLSHYEITCKFRGDDRWEEPRRVKPCSTEGGTEADGVCETLPTDWKFVDDLADLSDAVRSAILPKAGEELALAAASAWNEAFGDAETVDFEYSIIPVDIAGTKGTERGIVVEAPRPVAPIRPATAELRFEVNAPHVQPDEGRRPDNLSVTIALDDKAWTKAGPENLGNGRFAHRLYRLVVDPEDVVASGSYGSDGMTDRPIGLRAAVKTEDELSFTFWADDIGKCICADASAIEPDREAREAFSYWLRLTGNGPEQTVLKRAFNDDEETETSDCQRAFLDGLWRRKGENRATRAASRFYLETLITITTSSSKRPSRQQISKSLVSRRVPLDIEVRIQPARTGGDVTLLRPDAFEWPVRFDFEALGPGEVRAASGFALFRAPAVGATLSDVLAGVNEASGIVTLRDPERRMLTMIEWDACPASSLTTDPEIVHGCAIGGFDVHELDIDDLAPLDSTASTEFAFNGELWSRSRRVARAQLIPSAAAMLTPDGTQDLLGWHAHYPSETWRASAASRSTDAAPSRRGYYSARESTLHFPSRPMRLRLIPIPDENVTTALMSGGKPLSVFAQIQTPDGKSIAPVLPTEEPDPNDPVAMLIKLFKTAIQHDSGEWEGWAEFRREKDVPFEPSDLRALQLFLSRPANMAPAGAGAILKLFGATKQETDWKPTGTIDVAVEFTSSLHPILEETIAELALDVNSDGGTPLLYRRFKPVVQPRPQLSAADAADFFGKTQPAKDPYGWGALQTLGLAATVRIFDGDTDTFIDARNLLDRINQVMRRVVIRYAAAVSDPIYDLGAPFVDILLAPGRDRVAGAFDATVQGQGVGFDPEDTLALAQISLRPRPKQVWHYHRIAAYWAKDRLNNDEMPEKKPEEGTPDVRTAAVVFQLVPGALAFDAEVLRPADARLVSLTAEQGKDASSAPVTLPPLSQPTRKGKDVDPALTLLIRSRGATEKQLQDLVGLKLVRRERTTTTIVDNGKSKPIVVEKEYLADAKPSDWLAYQKPKNIPVAGWSFEEISAPGSMDGDDAWAPVDPFERFEPLSDDAWAMAFKDNGPGQAAYDSFCANARAAMPDLKGLEMPSASDVALYLDWSQRFLDHGAGPAKDLPTQRLSVAFAAPSSATPWRLATRADGTIALTFLHADRWAHARAYAVRPFGRYQELMIGAYAYASSATSDRGEARAELERLLPGWAKGKTINQLGYAVAVSPRTEKLEPPLILGSALWRPANGDTREPAWRLVVSRHAEEALAFSNRPVFGRLGWEGVALSFTRDYREPEWPGRLATVKSGDGQWEAQLHPGKIPGFPAVDKLADNPVITREDLGELAGEFPTLWKGADVYRFPFLPHHYRVTVLAAARAGAVVSPIAVATQTEFSVEELQPGYLRDADANAGTAETGNTQLQRLGGGLTRLVVSWRLPSHADLMAQKTRDMWVGDDRDVAHWPDPDIAYVLERSFARDGKLVLDEDADIRLVARAPDNVSSGETAQPIVLRARGTRFKAPLDDQTDNGKISVTRTVKGSFVVSVPLAITGREGLASTATLAPLATIGLKGDAANVNEEDIALFNGLACWDDTDGIKRAFALIRSVYALKLAYKPKDTDGPDEVVAAARALAEEAANAAQSMAPEDRWARQLDRFAKETIAWASNPATTPGSVQEALAGAKLPMVIEDYWPNDEKFPLATGTGAAADSTFVALSGSDTRSPVLALYDLPSTAEIKVLDNNSGTSALKAVMAQLREAAMEIISGGADALNLRAVHGRTGPNGTPGSVTVRLPWPEELN